MNLVQLYWITLLYECYGYYINFMLYLDSCIWKTGRKDAFEPLIHYKCFYYQYLCMIHLECKGEIHFDMCNTI